MISYRLRKKEMVFLLDFFGDINTLPQSFGNIYIDRQRYSEIAEDLNMKGIINLIDQTASADTAVEVIFRSIYESSVVFTDESLNIWCYCNQDIIILIRYDHIRKNEYIITPLRTTDMLAEIIANEFGSSDFIMLRPSYRNIEYEKIYELLCGEDL